MYSLHSVTALKGYDWAENFKDGMEVQGNMITSMGIFALYVNAQRGATRGYPWRSTIFFLGGERSQFLGGFASGAIQGREFAVKC